MDDKALRRMASHVDEQHREAMRSIDDLGEVHFGTGDPAAVASRRSFLRRATVAGAAITIGSVTIPLAATFPAAAQTSSSPPPLDDSDVGIVRYAQSVELAAVAAYVSAVNTKQLDDTANELCRLFGRHHQEHADALAGLLPKGTPAGKANEKLVDALTPQIDNASDQAGVLRIAYQLEQGAAATYQFALGQIINQTVAGAAGSIEPVEAQHSVVLGQLLNIDPNDYLPAFQSQTGALSPQTYALS